MNLTERRSELVFGAMLIMILLAVTLPELPGQVLVGVLWGGAGVLMVGLPPGERIPRLWTLLGVGFVVFSALGFLPREWVGLSSWRVELEALGLDTGRSGFVQPWLAVEAWAGFAVSAMTALYLLGHRVNSRGLILIALPFSLAAAAWALAAVITHHPNSTFGFFPNRNHTATWLTMGGMVGLGCLMHAILERSVAKIVLACVATCTCLGVLVTFSESRAGIVLLSGGMLAWVGLTGVSHLRGHVGKAVALAILLIGGIFLLNESTMKSRWESTLERIDTTTATGNGSSDSQRPEVDFTDSTTTAPSVVDMDGRITIFQDSWSMIRQEAWTGVGPGQFVAVFPQHRAATNASNNSRCLHPESDWLMMLAEVGWPATVCLAAGVIAVLASGIRRARPTRGRLLRGACLVGASVVAFHGLFDVPGHRVGLAWAAVLLAAAAIPPSGDKESATRVRQWPWRIIGAALAVTGIGLVVGQILKIPILPTARVRQHMETAKALYDADQKAYQTAIAEGREYQPPKDQDPLEQALPEVSRAIGYSPLDPHLHSTRGILALCFDDKNDIARSELAIERRLVPTDVGLVLRQAMAWGVQSVPEVAWHWQEALRRSRSEETRHPHGLTRPLQTYHEILAFCGNDPSRWDAALEIARPHPDWLVAWARSAPVPRLDAQLATVLPALSDAQARREILEIWLKRSRSEAVRQIVRDHPDWGVAAP